MGTRTHISPRTSSWHASWEVLITNQTFLAGTSAVYRGVDWSWCQGRGKWWCWVGRCWCWGGGCWGGRKTDEARTQTYTLREPEQSKCISTCHKSRTIRKFTGNTPQTEWGAPRSGTCLYTHRKNPSVWTKLFGESKDRLQLPASVSLLDFWTCRWPGHTGTRAQPNPRAHGHNPDPRAHGHTGTRAEPTRGPTSRFHFAKHRCWEGTSSWCCYVFYYYGALRVKSFCPVWKQVHAVGKTWFNVKTCSFWGITVLPWILVIIGQSCQYISLVGSSPSFCSSFLFAVFQAWLEK